MNTNDINAGGTQDPGPDDQQQQTAGNNAQGAPSTTTAAPTDTPDTGSNSFADVAEKNKPFQSPEKDEERQHLYGMTEKLLVTARYEWPEYRQPMEDVILSLREKQVLFIECPDLDQFHLATQRLATSLQTMGHLLGDLPAPVRSNKRDQRLKSYFWKTLKKQSTPVIIILYHYYLEHIKTLLARDDKEVFADIMESLQSRNIYLICPLPDSPETRQITGEERAKTLLKNTYAHWLMPVVKLTLTKRYNIASHELLQAIQEDPELNTVSLFDQHHLLRSIPDDAPEATLLLLMKKANHEYISRLDKGVEHLSALLMGEDVLAQTVIFTAAFFPGIGMTDFSYLVDYLLGEEMELQAVTTDKKSARTLKELWGSRAIVQQYLNKCMLRASDSEGKVVIDFTEHKLRDTIRRLIRRDFLFLYYNIFENLASSGLLFKPDVPQGLREAIIHFIVSAAHKIVSCHEADWLKDLFFENLRNILEHVIKDDEEVISVIRNAPELLPDAIMARVLKVASNNKLLQNSITTDLSLLFGDMIKAEGRAFHVTLNAFVRKLIDLYRIDETGLDIILPIYKKILSDNEIAETGHGQPAPGDEDKLTREGLINHFSKALEDGTAEQMFYAYNKMRDHFGRWTFLGISNDWINDKEITAKKWTKKMAWLFQIDFCIYSFINYFDKEDKNVYELFTDPQDTFTSDLTTLARNITSEACLQACDELLPYKETFDSRMYWLEYGVTEILPLDTRIKPQYKKAYTLSADIIENWFYILSSEKIKQQVEEDPTWSSFAAIITREAFPKSLSLIMQYWRVKTGIYTDTILTVDFIVKDKTEKEKKIQTLQLRRACLRKLLVTFPLN